MAASPSSSDTREIPDKDVESLKAEIAALKSDVSRLTETAKKTAGDTAARGRERARQAAEHSRDQAKETVGMVESEISERPITSIAAAFGIGFIIGKLLDR